MEGEEEEGYSTPPWLKPRSATEGAMLRLHFALYSPIFFVPTDYKQKYDCHSTDVHGSLQCLTVKHIGRLYQKNKSFE